MSGRDLLFWIVADSVFHFLSQQFDFFRGEIEETIDALVEFGFGGLERLT